MHAPVFQWFSTGLPKVLQRAYVSVSALTCPRTFVFNPVRGSLCLYCRTDTPVSSRSRFCPCVIATVSMPVCVGLHVVSVIPPACVSLQTLGGKSCRGHQGRATEGNTGREAMAGPTGRGPGRLAGQACRRASPMGTGQGSCRAGVEGSQGAG